MLAHSTWDCLFLLKSKLRTCCDLRISYNDFILIYMDVFACFDAVLMVWGTGALTRTGNSKVSRTIKAINKGFVKLKEATAKLPDEL